MYGKHFASMYSGSMVGAGACAFAVMGYVIATAVPDKKVGTQVELNSKLLSLIIGEKEGEVEKAIDFLCAPDPKSRSKEAEGRRLVRLGQFAYQVVNGAHYRSIRDEEERREQNRKAAEKYRAKEAKAKGKTSGGPTMAEKLHVKGVEDGTIDPDTGEPIRNGE